MKFAIILVCSLFGALLGEVPEEQKSDIRVNFYDFAGPWVLLYWGVPEELFPYKEMKCLNLWVNVSKERYATADATVIYKNNKEEQVNFQTTATELSDNKYVYSLTANEQSINYKIIDFNKYKYAAVITFIEGKKYLYVYGRDPNALQDCGDKLGKWLEGTDNKDNPAYKIKPSECACVSDAAN